MALQEVKVIDKIEVVENGTLQVREATRIMKDGEQIAQMYLQCQLMCKQLLKQYGQLRLSLPISKLRLRLKQD